MNHNALPQPSDVNSYESQAETVADTFSSLTSENQEQVVTEHAEATDHVQEVVTQPKNIGDIVTVDTRGRHHIPAGSGSRSGQMLSKEHLDLISVHATEIRRGIINRDVLPIAPLKYINKADLPPVPNAKKADEYVSMGILDAFHNEAWARRVSGIQETDKADDQVSIMDMIRDEKQKYDAEHEGQSQPPELKDLSKGTLSRRASDVMKWAKKSISLVREKGADGSRKVYSKTTNAVSEAVAWYSDERTSDKQKYGVVAGAVAVAVVALAAKYGIESHDSLFNGTHNQAGGVNPLEHTQLEPPLPNPNDPTIDAEGITVPSTTYTPAAEVAPVVPLPSPEVAAYVTLDSPGDSPWNAAQDYLRAQGAEPTNAQIAELKNHMLAAAGLTEAQAQHLPQGTQLRVS